MKAEETSGRYLGEVIRSFGVLGVTAFGGPTAHLGYFREEFVARRAWLSERSYADIVAIAQFMPGPASSQVGMALGYHRAGWAGMLAAWVMFTLPSAAILATFGLLMSTYAVDGDQGWIRGLLAAAVAVVFHAVAGMAGGMANTRLTATIAVIAGLIVLTVPGPLTHVAVILAAGVAGVLLLRGSVSENGDDDGLDEIRPVSSRAAVTGLVLFFVLLVGLWLGAATVGGDLLTRASAYFQTGALVFGGGHVVLPLLEQQTVITGWVTQSQFLAGYSAAQAVPGPLFTFASFLGAVDGGMWGAILATVAVFLPSALLMTAGLHFWGRWRHSPVLRAAFTAVNAAVVGLLGAALWDPVLVHGVTGVASLSIAALCWLGLATWKLPPWSIALFAALAGWVLL
ncbi:chromate efflux transporter [Corynebacterium comes]|uniref:Chromate transport protein n=1 Tax=Corynebacterium comes TaxID=2675218 RepID=A0A6B8VMV6_9CORY|nr:chromate efflux transporter [Corynebacterium comes]QGU05353.1 putative chromate transport protein [Corynebacterium comes]